MGTITKRRKISQAKDDSQNVTGDKIESDTEENQDKNLGVIEHSYSGEWSRDLPNGQGQEHFSYDYSVLKEEDVKRTENYHNCTLKNIFMAIQAKWQ